MQPSGRIRSGCESTSRAAPFKVQMHSTKGWRIADGLRSVYFIARIVCLPLRTRQRLDNSPHQVGIRELGLIARALSRYRKQPRSQWFIPSIRKPRNVADDSPDLLFRDITGKRKRIHAACAYRRIGEDGIERKRSFGPALSKKVVFHDRDHQP